MAGVYLCRVIRQAAHKAPTGGFGMHWTQAKREQGRAELQAGLALITASLMRVIRQVQPPSYAALLFGVHALWRKHAAGTELDTIEGSRVTDRCACLFNSIHSLLST
jgi:hypothetical protein